MYMLNEALPAPNAYKCHPHIHPSTALIKLTTTSQTMPPHNPPPQKMQPFPQKDATQNPKCPLWRVSETRQPESSHALKSTFLRKTSPPSVTWGGCCVVVVRVEMVACGGMGSVGEGGEVWEVAGCWISGGLLGCFWSRSCSFETVFLNLERQRSYRRNKLKLFLFLVLRWALYFSTLRQQLFTQPTTTRSEL